MLLYKQPGISQTVRLGDCSVGILGCFYGNEKGMENRNSGGWTEDPECVAFSFLYLLDSDRHKHKHTHTYVTPLQIKVVWIINHKEPFSKGILQNRT